jgi:hypothetical protein
VVQPLAAKEETGAEPDKEVIGFMTYELLNGVRG